LRRKLLAVNYAPVQPSSLVLDHCTTGKGRAGRYQGTLHWSENGECERRCAATRARTPLLDSSLSHTFRIQRPTYTLLWTISCDPPRPHKLGLLCSSLFAHFQPRRAVETVNYSRIRIEAIRFGKGCRMNQKPHTCCDAAKMSLGEKTPSNACAIDILRRYPHGRFS
jgi:hypothetical protein